MDKSGTDARTHGRTDARTHGHTDARTHGRSGDYMLPRNSSGSIKTGDFYLKIFSFLEVKISMYLNRRVFVMVISRVIEEGSALSSFSE